MEVLKKFIPSSDKKRIERSVSALNYQKYDFALQETLENGAILRKASLTSSGGLSVDIGTLIDSFEVVNGDNTFCLPAETRVGNLAFTPFRIDHYEAGMQSMALAVFCRDLPVFFDQINTWDMAPEYLFGVTNKNLADFVIKNFGFNVIKHFPKKNKRVVHDKYQIVGKFTDLEKAATIFSERKIKGRPIKEVLMERALDQASLVKLKLTKYHPEANTNFEIDELLEYSDKKPFLKIGFDTFGYGVVATGLSCKALIDYSNNYNFSAGIESTLALASAIQAWRKRE